MEQEEDEITPEMVRAALIELWSSEARAVDEVYETIMLRVLRAALRVRRAPKTV